MFVAKSPRAPSFSRLLASLRADRPARWVPVEKRVDDAGSTARPVTRGGAAAATRCAGRDALDDADRRRRPDADDLRRQHGHRRGRGVSLTVGGTLQIQGTAASPVKLVGATRRPPAPGPAWCSTRAAQVTATYVEIHGADTAIAARPGSMYSFDHLVIDTSSSMLVLSSNGTIAHGTLRGLGDSQSWLAGADQQRLAPDHQYLGDPGVVRRRRHDRRRGRLLGAAVRSRRGRRFALCVPLQREHRRHHQQLVRSSQRLRLHGDRVPVRPLQSQQLGRQRDQHRHAARAASPTRSRTTTSRATRSATGAARRWR